MSTLEGLLIFAGIPLLIVVAITVMVMAPSLARGNQPRSGSNWKAEPEWFGAPRAVGAREAMANRHQIESGPAAGHNPASAGDHDNVVSDDHGVTGARRRGAGATAMGAEQAPVTSSQDDSDSEQTGGASVRW